MNNQLKDKWTVCNNQPNFQDSGRQGTCKIYMDTTIV